MRKPLLLLLSLLLLLGCRPTALSPDVPGTGTVVQEPVRLWGRVNAAYSAQATAAELVGHATVSLLNAANTVVATGLTDSAGAFSLNPFESWVPTDNEVYALDAVKSFDATNDRAVLRFRTLVSWDGAKWRSISGTTTAPKGGSGVLINARTTALAAIQNLKALTASSFLGAIDPSTGAYTVAGGIPSSELDTVSGLVNQALAANLDPLSWLTYSMTAMTYSLKIGPQAEKPLFDLEDAISHLDTPLTMVQGRQGRGIAFAAVPAITDLQFGGFGAAPGLFNWASSVAADRLGNLVVVDVNNNRIQKFTPEGIFLSSMGSFGAGSGQLNKPRGVDVDRNGNILVADLENHRVQKFSASGTFLFGLGAGSKWTGVAPAVASGTAHGYFTQPFFVKFDPVGNFWVSDNLNHRLIKYDANGTFMMGIGSGTVWTAAAGNAAASGAGNGWFNDVAGIAIAPYGDLFVVDRGNSRVQRFRSDGTYVTQWGTAGAGNGQFSSPCGIAIDSSGIVWVAEEGNHRVQKFTPDGTYLGQFGTTGAGAGQFSAPREPAFGPDGSLFVTENSGHRVQRFIPAQPPTLFPAGSIKSSEGTVEMWFKPFWEGVDPGGYRTFFRAEGGNNFNIGLHKVTGGIFYMYITDNGADPTHQLRVGMDAATTAKTIRPREWHHLAVTWKASTGDMRFYLNGVEQRSYTTNLGTPMNFAQPLRIAVGGEISGTNPATAIIDGFRIYGTAKSYDEIRRSAAGLVQE